MSVYNSSVTSAEPIEIKSAELWLVALHFLGVVVACTCKLYRNPYNVAGGFYFSIEIRSGPLCA